MLRSAYVALAFACVLTAQDAKTEAKPAPESKPAESRPASRRTETRPQLRVVVPFFGNTICPILEQPAKQDVFLETARGRIFFCCPECQEKARADIEAAYAKAYPVTKKVQNPVDPIDQRPVRTGATAVYQGYEINLSDPSRAQEVVENGDIYVALLTIPGLKDVGNVMDPRSPVEVAKNLAVIIGDYLVRIGEPKTIELAKKFPDKVLQVAMNQKRKPTKGR